MPNPMQSQQAAQQAARAAQQGAMAAQQVAHAKRQAVTQEKSKLSWWRLGQAGLMGFYYIPLGPLSPLHIINDMVK